MKYDIIGDVHGCSETLKELLRKLGHDRGSDSIFKHATRTAVFLGDPIDRGPERREVLSIVKPMIESGAAKSVLGNHEYNAIAYATAGEERGTYLRPHSQNNAKQHKAFLDACAVNPGEYEK